MPGSARPYDHTARARYSWRRPSGSWSPLSLQQHAGSPDVIVLPGAELQELARTRDDAEDRARELLATEVLRAARNGNGSDDERTRQLVLAVRRDLLTELRSQEQEQARRRARRRRRTAARTPSPGSCRA